MLYYRALSRSFIPRGIDLCCIIGLQVGQFIPRGVDLCCIRGLQVGLFIPRGVD